MRNLRIGSVLMKASSFCSVASTSALYFMPSPRLLTPPSITMTVPSMSRNADVLAAPTANFVYFEVITCSGVAAMTSSFTPSAAVTTLPGATGGGVTAVLTVVVVVVVAGAGGAAGTRTGVIGTA